MKTFIKYISFNNLISLIIILSLVWDTLQSINQSKFNITSLGELWFKINVETLLLAQAVTQRYISEIIWDPVIQYILILPIWLGLILLLLFVNIVFYLKKKLSHHLSSKQQ